MFQTTPTDLDGDSLCHRQRNSPCPPGRHVRGTPVVSLEFLTPAVCRVPAFLTYRTAALLRMGPWQMSRVSWTVQFSETGSPLDF